MGTSLQRNLLNESAVHESSSASPAIAATQELLVHTKMEIAGMRRVELAEGGGLKCHCSLRTRGDLCRDTALNGTMRAAATSWCFCAP